jgi:hypothetical protein
VAFDDFAELIKFLMTPKIDSFDGMAGSPFFTVLYLLNKKIFLNRAFRGLL